MALPLPAPPPPPAVGSVSMTRQQRHGTSTAPLRRSRSLHSVAAAAGVVPLLLGLAVASSQLDAETLSNIPPTLSGEDSGHARIRHPKSRQAERCTGKCVGTCIRGGAGSPGEGPLNIRRPLVVFKQEFRSRQYCLVECSDICNLIKDGEDGP